MPAFKTNDFWIIDAVDQSKVLQFDVASLGTGTTRTLTAPYNGNGTLAIAEFANAWTANQSFGAACSLIFTDTNGVILHRLTSGTTGYALRWENHVGAGYTVIDYLGQFQISSTQHVFADPSDITKTLNIDLSGCTTGTGLQLIAAVTASRVLTFPNVTAVFAAVGNDADPPAAGAMGKVNRTAQVAAITATNLTNTTPAGYYVVDWTLEATTADVTAGTIQFGIAYTDDIGATTQAGALLALTATGRDRGSFQVWLASGNITYNTALVGIFGTSAYALRVRCTFLG